MGRDGGGQERNILRQVRNLNVWGGGKFSPQKVLYHYSCSSSKIHSQCPYSHSLIQWRN